MALSDRIMNIVRRMPGRRYRLLSPFIARSGQRLANVHGALMELDLADLIQRRIYLGTFSRLEDRIIKRVLKPGDTMVDAGANVGYMTVLGARCVTSSGTVLSFEPNPNAFAKMSATITRSGLTQCKVMQIGLSNHDGELTLYQNPPENHHLNSTMNWMDGAVAYRVQVRTLDRCLADAGVEKVDLLKADVEGHEPLLFEGAEASLRSGRIRNILCEFNDHYLRKIGWNSSSLYDSLKQRGFELTGGDPPDFKPQEITTHLFTHRADTLNGSSAVRSSTRIGRR